MNRACLHIDPGLLARGGEHGLGDQCAPQAVGEGRQSLRGRAVADRVVDVSHECGEAVRVALRMPAGEKCVSRRRRGQRRGIAANDRRRPREPRTRAPRGAPGRTRAPRRRRPARSRAGSCGRRRPDSPAWIPSLRRRSRTGRPRRPRSRPAGPRRTRRPARTRVVRPRSCAPAPSVSIRAESRVMRWPEMNSARSHQWEPMSAKAREAPPKRSSTRQLSSSARRSQSCR